MKKQYKYSRKEIINKLADIQKRWSENGDLQLLKLLTATKQPKVECEICGYSMSKGLCHNRKNHPQLKDIEPLERNVGEPPWVDLKRVYDKIDELTERINLLSNLLNKQ